MSRLQSPHYAFYSVIGRVNMSPIEILNVPVSEEETVRLRDPLGTKDTGTVSGTDGRTTPEVTVERP